MMEFVHGDMFEAPVDIRVNTVNCVGVMGAGVALAFKRRYPEMFKEYQRACRDGLVEPGRLHVWRSLSGEWVINFPTKRDWREASRYEYIREGLDALREYLRGAGPVSIAIPALGCGHGGLDWGQVSQMIRNKLGDLEAQILVFAPADSRRAGERAEYDTSDQALNEAEELGYSELPGSVLGDAYPGGSIFVRGNSESLRSPWLALVSSSTPGEKEIEAVCSVALEVSKRSKSLNIALLYTSRASESLIDALTHYGIRVVVLLPFGVLSRKAVALFSPLNADLVTVVSVAQPHLQWNRTLVARAMNLLRSQASAMLLSDPDPGWMVEHLSKRNTTCPVYFLRYDGLNGELRNRLASVGAIPIGRRSDAGVPNVDAMVATLSPQQGRDYASPSVRSTHGNSTSVRVDLNDYSPHHWTEIIALAKKAGANNIFLDFTMPNRVRAGEIQHYILNIDRLSDRASEPQYRIAGRELRFIEQEGAYNPDRLTVYGHALAGQESVTYSVSREALADLEGLRQPTKDQLIGAFARHKGAIRRIVQRKFDADQFEDGHVILVTREDLLR